MLSRCCFCLHWGSTWGSRQDPTDEQSVLWKYGTYFNSCSTCSEKALRNTPINVNRGRSTGTGIQETIWNPASLNGSSSWSLKERFFSGWGTAEWRLLVQSLEDWIFSVPWEAEAGKEKVYGNNQNSTNLHGRKMWLSWWWRSASCLKLCPTIKYASLGVSESEMTGVILSSFSPVTKGIKTMNSFFLTLRKSRNVYLIFLWEKGGSEVLS